MQISRYYQSMVNLLLVFHEMRKRKTYSEFSIGYILSVQFSLFAQSCPTPCNPMDCNPSVFPIHHQLLELAQGVP